MKTIDYYLNQPEGQTYDKKSGRIEPKALAVTMVAMANADGGTIAIGIEDDGTISGIDGMTEHTNDLLRVPFDYCIPSVNVHPQRIPCIDKEGNDNHILILEVEQSSAMHATSSDEAYYRVGDKSKKLSFDDRMQIMLAKGVQYYEDYPIARATVDDLDLDFVSGYCKRIGYKKDALTFLRTNGDYILIKDGKEQISGAAILLFGKDPQRFFQRAWVRFIRYDGTEEKVGREMNVIKDVIFKGRILDMTRDAIAFVKTQIKEHTYLGPEARFVTEVEYPEFCWTELIVNAIAHRDYSILGTDIQIKMFDDHYTVESPGILPGRVRLNNMRTTHFSRNPKIAAFMKEYEFIREFGEGVDRMYRELEEGGWPKPVFKQDDFMLRASLSSRFAPDTAPKISPETLTISHIKDGNSVSQVVTDMSPAVTSLSQVLSQVCHKLDREYYASAINVMAGLTKEPQSLRSLMQLTGDTNRGRFKNNVLRHLLDAGFVEPTITDNPNSSKQKYTLTVKGKELMKPYEI